MRPARSRTVPSRILHGPLRSAVFLLALPVLGEQILNFLVGFYDVYLSGHLDESVRTSATAAVGVAAYVGWLASMVFSMVATGTTALISRAWGAEDREQANRVANRSVALAVIVGVGFLVLIYPAAPTVVRLMGLSGDAVPIAMRYLRIDAIGLVSSSLSLVLAAALRGSGDMRTPMWIFSLVNVVNILVSTVLVRGLWGGPELGVDGIVIGTLTARLIGGFLFVLILLKGVNGLRLQFREFGVRGETVRRILAVGAPAAGEGIVMWLGHCVFLRIISSLGPEEFAAHIIGVRVEAITYLPAVAWGAAASTMVGQSLGAGDSTRARHAGHEAALQCALFGILITFWFSLGADWIYATMHRDPDVQAAGSFPFRIVGLFQIPLILAIVYSAGLRGAGDTRFPLYITLLTTYLLRIPVGYYLGVVCNLGLLGAWMGMNIDMLLRGVLSTWRYTAGGWTDTKI
ncbi:MAG: MATE family efflux transporter [Planctomycetaceae bacterium]|nr:MATE family efflux transporter [Planctomycetaceae bacterium]